MLYEFCLKGHYAFDLLNNIDISSAYISSSKPSIDHYEFSFSEMII